MYRYTIILVSSVRKYLLIANELQEIAFDANEIWKQSAVLPVQEEGEHLDRTHEYGLDPKWAEDFLEYNTDAVQNNTNKDDITQTKEDEDPNFEYSKFMKFMEREGDIPIESNQTAMFDLSGTSEEWTEQFIENNTASTNDNTILNKVEEELEAAGTWIDEFTKENPATGNIFNLFF